MFGIDDTVLLMLGGICVMLVGWFGLAGGFRRRFRRQVQRAFSQFASGRGPEIKWSVPGGNPKIRLGASRAQVLTDLSRAEVIALNQLLRATRDHAPQDPAYLEANELHMKIRSLKKAIEQSAGEIRKSPTSSASIKNPLELIRISRS